MLLDSIRKLSFDQKKLLFDQHKEFPIFMIFLNSVPTLGYSRIHKFNRGITIYCTQFLLSYLYFRYSYSRNLVDFDTDYYSLHLGSNLQAVVNNSYYKARMHLGLPPLLVE